MRWKQACVSGKPCNSTSGGPLPPARAKTRPASPSIQCDAKPGKRSSIMRSGSGPPRRAGERPPPAPPSIKCDAKRGKRSSIMRSGSGPPRRHVISPGEVVTLEEKNVVASFRERIREAIAEVQRRWVPPFAILGESLSGESPLRGIDCPHIEPEL